MRERGTIKRYFRDRGFGFVSRPTGSDVFLHVADLLVRDDETRLLIGAEVEFEVTQAERGPRAINVDLV